MNARGLTLIEVVVAAALVLSVVIVASTTIGSLAGATARADRGTLADDRVADEIEALRALGFCDPGQPIGERADLVSTVFPHADAARNTDGAEYDPTPAHGFPAGTFTTTTADGQGILTVAATFVTATAAGWRPVAPSPAGPYDAGRSAPLPSVALLVTVSFVCHRRPQTARAGRQVVIAARPDGVCDVQAPPLEAGS